MYISKFVWPYIIRCRSLTSLPALTWYVHRLNVKTCQFLSDGSRFCIATESPHCYNTLYGTSEMYYSQTSTRNLKNLHTVIMAVRNGRMPKCDLMDSIRMGTNLIQWCSRVGGGGGGRGGGVLGPRPPSLYFVIPFQK